MEEYTRGPGNSRRRRKTQMEIIKEAYLPVIFLGITVVLIIIFIAGALIRRANSDTQLSATIPTDTTPTVDVYAAEVDRLLTESAALAAEYDYQGAADLIDTFSGDITAYPALTATKNEYLQLSANMITWADPSQITTLSFHTLIADASRAFPNKNYGTAYNKNFVTVEEFTKILDQLYSKGYILVSLDDFTTCTVTEDGKTECAVKSLQLPMGKKPLLLVQTNVNYYTYMVDGDGDGEPDKDGAGFASRMIVGADGKITCEMVDGSGNTVTGAYDLVPILEAFIELHPDFSYKGARAILAPSGYDGIFGYRTDAATKAEKGDDYHAQQVAGAQRLVAALRDSGYDLACYTYANASYGEVGAAEIQTDLRNWTAEVTPVFGATNILVYAQNSEIAEYSGSKYNVLQNAGFRYYIGFTASAVSTEHVQLKRITVTGSQMAHTNIYSNYFDAAAILDPSRGNVPK